ncbi:MAG: glycosyltransferase family 4 protein [Spirochaetia bacterium]|nr:glycosyltransferase family 4 protein [Spirochaetia bacterium]
MKLAFLSLYKTFDYSQVGGTDSMMRRLAEGLLENQKKIEIEFIFYGGGENNKRIAHNSRFSSAYFESLEASLRYIKSNDFYHVIACYLLPKDRLKYAFFRKKNKNKKYHSIIFFYPESRIKRVLKFLEYILFSYNGSVFCVSKRQYSYLRRFVKKLVLLPPSVTKSYFLKPGQKMFKKKIQVAFLGRIDARKGIDKVISLFHKLSEDKRFVCSIYGIVIQSDKEAYEIYKSLKKQKEIKFIEIDRKDYNDKIDKKVRDLLKNTDVFLQPYQNLDSTVDMPLLILEAMASLCLIITTPAGDVAEIYGSQNFVVKKDSFAETAFEIINRLDKKTLFVERKRLYKRAAELTFNNLYIAKRFLNEINN